MQPVLWHPPVELSESEEHIVKRIRRAKLFVFLRHHRHELLDEVFQRELAGLYRTSKRGQPPIAPAQLALAPLCKPTQVSQMMKSLKRRSWIGGGSWSSIVWTPIKHRSAKELWWRSARDSSRGRWTGGMYSTTWIAV